MAPHSLEDGHYGGGPVSGGPAGSDDGARAAGSRSHLRGTPPSEVHDLVCVGFGPASLAVAVALHDSAARLGRPPRVLFLEKQARFAWHAGMLLPGAKMQISFVKDMATLRDPTSRFTFLNYLHESGRLVEFTNLGTFLPARVEYEDYLRWCAGFFDDVVRYGSEVVSVSPVRPTDADAADSASVSAFAVSSRDVASGATTTYRARNVLLAIGGQPSIPACLPSGHARVIHSSQYAHLVPEILGRRPDAPHRVAVIGAGQSAAEIFNNIQTLYPRSRTTLVMRSEFLKPSDDSPFVNSIFNPSYVDSLFARPPELRRSLLADARSTNYGVVRLELIEHLYERMYHQRRDYGADETRWPHRIMGSAEVVGFSERPDGSGVQLTVRPAHHHHGSSNDDGPAAAAAGDVETTLDVDLVIAATGYRRQSHLSMMEGLADLLPGTSDEEGGPSPAAAKGARPSMSEGRIGDRNVKVSRDYSLQFAPGKVAPGSGIWLQGCCEGSHGLSDTLLSILAVRSGEIVQSIFGATGSP